jgi:hypothetical protein
MRACVWTFKVMTWTHIFAVDLGTINSNAMPATLPMPATAKPLMDPQSTAAAHAVTSS